MKFQEHSDVRRQLNTVSATYPSYQSIPLSDTDNVLFSSRVFRAIRSILRFLSLWRPQSAGFIERYVYPIFINLLLLTTGPIRNSILVTENSTWLSIQLLYIIHEVVIWLGHILGNHYFASRDLENNVIMPMNKLTGIKKPLNRRLTFVNVAVILPMTTFSIVLCTLFIVTRILWTHGEERFSAQFPNVHGLMDNILYGLVVISIVYNLGVGLALFWTLTLLYSCYAARLKILENIFLKWKHSSVEAVSLFMEMYARPVKRSWKHVSWWFLAHNIVALAIPLYGYELAEAVSGGAYSVKHLPQFICYMIYIMTIWLGPTVVGEQLKQREIKLVERMNDISPSSLENDTVSHKWKELGEFSSTSLNVLNSRNYRYQTSSIDLINSLSLEISDRRSNYDKFTFASRSEELKKFMSFLKERKPGLVSRGYSFQLNLSLFSLIVGGISFLLQLHSINIGETVYKNSNRTMS